MQTIAKQAPQLLGTTQVARILSVSVSTLKGWRVQGVGPAWIRMEGVVRYNVADVEAYLAHCRQVPSVRAVLEEHVAHL
jgi:predicted site-specific integrase-resolvase